MHREDIALAACSDIPVLIASDRAEDREACAREIHEQSGRTDRPFVRFSGAALSAQDREVCRRLRDQFECARGGTLFIDDIARLGPGGQRELSHLLERRIASPARGGARILAGAGSDLDDRRTTGGFNPSLYYRLNEIRLDLAATKSAGHMSRSLTAGARSA